MSCQAIRSLNNLASTQTLVSRSLRTAQKPRKRRRRGGGFDDRSWKNHLWSSDSEVFDLLKVIGVCPIVISKTAPYHFKTVFCHRIGAKRYLRQNCPHSAAKSGSSEICCIVGSHNCAPRPQTLYRPLHTIWPVPRSVECLLWFDVGLAHHFTTLKLGTPAVTLILQTLESPDHFPVCLTKARHHFFERSTRKYVPTTP